jgi:hypothetical protein
MSHGKSPREAERKQRLIAVARRPERVPMSAVHMLLGLIIVILVLGASGAMV